MAINLTSRVRCNCRSMPQEPHQSVDSSLLIVCIASTCACRVLMFASTSIVPISLQLLDTVPRMNVQSLYGQRYSITVTIDIELNAS